MGSEERITRRLLKKAISGSYGEMNAIAKKAGCNVRTIYRKLRQYPELMDLVEEEKAVLRITQKELAMNSILEALTKKAEETDKDKDRRIKVAMWAAERLGADEGYNPTLKVDKQGADITEYVFVDGLHGLDKVADEKTETN